jgi:hypothetical protein
VTLLRLRLGLHTKVRSRLRHKRDKLTILDYHLHEYILALWGMPLGEMLDLEKLAQTCREKNRWFFFFSSAPANCPGKSERLGNITCFDSGTTGGVSSHVNGTAIF